jgi:hypothetical protein
VQLSETKLGRMSSLIMKFYVHSIIDIYGSVKRISPEAKAQMMLDMQTVFLYCRKFVLEGVDALEAYAEKFFELVVYDKPTALSNLVTYLPEYPLRILKNFYLFASRDGGQRKSVIGSSYVVKTEDLVTIFELSRSCLISLVEDQKIIVDTDFSNTIVELVVQGNERSKTSTSN